MNLAVVLVSAQQMERDIIFFACHPAVMGGGWDIEARPRSQLIAGAVFHEDSHASGKHDAKMFDDTELSDSDPDMVGPLPARFISGSADGHIGHIDKLEAPFFKVLDFIRIIKELDQNFMIHLSRPSTTSKENLGNLTRLK